MDQVDVDRGRDGLGAATALPIGEVVEVFVELADTLVDDFDAVEFLQGLVDRCVSLLRATEAGVLLADETDTLQVMATSTERGRALELLQIQNREGPCLDCVASGTVVASADLSADRDRWPTFAAEAVDAGFPCVLALPLRLRHRVLGGLNLFATHPGALDAVDRTIGQAMADIAAISLLQERALRESRLLSEQLQTALNARIMIEQAKGMLAERTGVDVETAYEQLRAFARSHNRRLRVVARDLLDGSLAVEQLPEGP